MRLLGSILIITGHVKLNSSITRVKQGRRLASLPDPSMRRRLCQGPSLPPPPHLLWSHRVVRVILAGVPLLLPTSPPTSRTRKALPRRCGIIRCWRVSPRSPTVLPHVCHSVLRSEVHLTCRTCPNLLPPLPFVLLRCRINL